MKQLLQKIQSATIAYQYGMLDQAKHHALDVLSQLSLYTKETLPDYLMHKLNMLTLLQSIASRQHDTVSYASYEQEVQPLFQQLFPENNGSYYALHLFDAFECYLDAGEIVTAQYLLEKGLNLLLSEHEPCPLISFIHDTFQAKLLFRMEQYHACIDTCLRANSARWSESLIPNNADEFLQQYASQENLLLHNSVLCLLLLAQSYGKINNPTEGLAILEALHEDTYEDFYLQASIELALAELYTRADMLNKALPFYQKYRQAQFSQYSDLQAALSTLAFRLDPAYSSSSHTSQASTCYSKDAYVAMLYNHGLLLTYNQKYADAISIFSQLGDKGLSMHLAILALTEQHDAIPRLKKAADHYYEQEINSLFLYYDEHLVYNHLSLLEYHFSLCMEAYVACHQTKGEAFLSAQSIYDFLINTKYISLEASYLSHHYRTLEELKDRKSIRSSEIMNTLPNDTILLEYCITRNISDELHYVVFIITATQLHCIPLGNAQELHNLLNTWNATLHSSKSVALSDSESTPSKIWRKEQRDTDTALRRFLYLPLKEILAQYSSRKLLIAPVGALAAFPFDMLSVSASDYLGNKYDISYINTGKELLQKTATTSSLLDNPLLIGNPATLNFSPLPFAEAEIQMAANILNVYAYIGNEAVISLFDQTQYQAPTFLHIASHGIFHPSVSDKFMPDHDETYNMMDQSGLVLANGDFLSCNMISMLDLSNTTLSILSACQSGNSLFHSSEGTFGLRRAFKLANCRYIIATLWHIEDRSCSLFISYFYEELFCLQASENYNIPLAFHNALRKLREYKEHNIAIFSHPYYWAGYILIE